MYNLQIINHLKKEICNIKVEKSLTSIILRYSIKDSLLEKERKENNFWYKGSEDEIAELTKKNHLEIFEFLAQQHLEKNQGYGKNPKQFKTPCYVCNQKTLTTLGWNEEGYPDNLERFFCRLCRTIFDWIDIKDDPVELQQEMLSYYRVFQQKELSKDGQRLKEISEELSRIINRINKNYHFLNIEQRTPI